MSDDSVGSLLGRCLCFLEATKENWVWAKTSTTMLCQTLPFSFLIWAST